MDQNEKLRYLYTVKKYKTGNWQVLRQAYMRRPWKDLAGAATKDHV